MGSSVPAQPLVTRVPGVGEPEPFGSRDRLRVRSVSGTPRLVDADRRPVLLRGVNVNALVDYGRTGQKPIALRTRDFDQIAALGLSVIRLPISWSRVMPSPGRIDRAYLAKVSSAVRRAGRHRIYTVVSMHSDRYSADLGTGTEFDGAPPWAVETDGLACGDPRPRYYTPCAAAAARHFYAGDATRGRSLQAWYADAVVAAAAAGRRGGAGYAGIDVLNEPTDPDATPDAAATPAWTARLHDLQRTLVRRLRADGERAPIWIQPQGPRSTRALGAAVLPDLADRAIVYAPHAYIDVYDAVPTPATADRMRVQYRAFAREAARIRAATVIGEFPGAAGGAWEDLRREHLERQDRAAFGGITWLWKQPAGGYGWGTLTPEGGLRTDTEAAQVLSAPRVIAGNRRVRVTATAGQVEVRGSGSAQTVDVWLGTAFGAGDARGFDLQQGAAAPAIVVERSWSAAASLDGTTATGTAVRLRLPQGRSAATFVPAG